MGDCLGALGYVNLVREILHFLVLSELDSALPELILLALVSW